VEVGPTLEHSPILGERYGVSAGEHAEWTQGIQLGGEPLGLAAPVPDRCLHCRLQPVAGSGQPLRTQTGSPAKPRGQSSREVVQNSNDVPAVGHGQLGRGRGGGGADVGHQIGEGDVHFVPDGRDRGNPDRCQGPAHCLTVERGQIFTATTASAYDAEVYPRNAVHQPQGLHQLTDCTFTLDPGAHDQNPRARPALAGDGDHIVQCGAVPAGDQRNDRGVLGKGPLASRVEQPVLLEDRLDPLELLLLASHGRRGQHPGDNELEVSLVLVERRPAEHVHLGAVGRRLPGPSRVHPEQTAAHLAAFIAKSEVPVTAGPDLTLHQLSADPERSRGVLLE